MAEDYVVVAKPGEEDAQGEEEEEEELLPHRRPEAAAILDKLGAAHDHLLENGAWPRGDAAVDAACDEARALLTATIDGAVRKIPMLQALTATTGSEHKQVYEGVAAMLAKEDDYAEMARRGRKARKRINRGRPSQRTGSLVELYLDGKSAHAKLRPFLDAIAAPFASDAVDAHTGASAGVVALVAPLKAMWRSIEKSMMRPVVAQRGDAASLFDLCRGMLQCPDVPRMHGVLIALLASDKIVIDRFKDRVNSPSAGGWVD